MARVSYMGFLPSCIPLITDEASWPSVLLPDPESIQWRDPGTIPDNQEGAFFFSQPMPVISTKYAPYKQGMIALTKQELAYLYWKIKELTLVEADIDVTIKIPQSGHPDSEWNFGASSGEAGPIARTDAVDERDLVCLKLDTLAQQFSSDTFYPRNALNELFYKSPADSGASSFLFGGTAGAIGYGPYTTSYLTSSYYQNFLATWYSVSGGSIKNLWYDPDDDLYYWCPGLNLEILGPQVAVDWNSTGVFGYGALSGGTIQAAPIDPANFPTGIIKSALSLDNFYRQSGIQPSAPFAPIYEKNWVSGAYSYGLTPGVGTFSMTINGKEYSCPLHLCAFVKLPKDEPNPYIEFENTTLLTEASGSGNASIEENSTWGYSD